MGGKLSYPQVELKDKVAIVTGGNTGIGYETAKALAIMGAHTIIACRSEERGQQVSLPVLLQYVSMIVVPRIYYLLIYTLPSILDQLEIQQFGAYPINSNDNLIRSHSYHRYNLWTNNM